MSIYRCFNHADCFVLVDKKFYTTLYHEVSEHHKFLFLQLFAVSFSLVSPELNK